MLIVTTLLGLMDELVSDMLWERVRPLLLVRPPSGTATRGVRR
jgi:hypothetical protein